MIRLLLQRKSLLHTSLRFISVGLNIDSELSLIRGGRTTREEKGNTRRGELTSRRARIFPCRMSLANESGLKAHGLMGISVTFEKENS